MNIPNSSNDNNSIYPIEFKNLKKSYDGQKEALKGVSFFIQSGEIFGLLGPNGAGKTSLINILTGLENSTSGHAYVYGQDVSLGTFQTKTALGLVPQELINHGFFTVTEILKFQAGYYGIKPEKGEVEDLIERLGLTEHQEKKVLQLSGGMKRRFLIAKALVTRPKVLLLDEPTAGVDIALRESLWEFVKDQNRKGLTVLLTTHYLEEAEQLCHRVAVLDHGELKAIDQTRALISNATFKKIKLQFSKQADHKWDEHPAFISRSVNEIVFRIPSHQASGAFLAALDIRLAELEDIQIQEGTLEEAMKTILSSTKSETAGNRGLK